MSPQDFSVLWVISSHLGVVYELSGDVVVVLHKGEQLFTIDRATAKGCPTYNPWQMEAWVYEHYMDIVIQFVNLKEAI